MKYFRQVATALVVVAATLAPALNSPWREVCVAVVAVGAAFGVTATHAAAKRAEQAVKDSQGSA